MNWQVIVRTAPIVALVVAGERRRSVVESCERQEYLVAVLALYLEAAIGLRPCAIIDKLVYLFICGHAPCAALPMIDAWYKAFNVKKGDKMFVPKNKRAHVW